MSESKGVLSVRHSSQVAKQTYVLCAFNVAAGPRRIFEEGRVIIFGMKLLLTLTSVGKTEGQLGDGLYTGLSCPCQAGEGRYPEAAVLDERDAQKSGQDEGKRSR
jgi:hypothetical protein